MLVNLNEVLLDAKENAFSVGERKKINIKYFNSSFL